MHLTTITLALIKARFPDKCYQYGMTHIQTHIHTQIVTTRLTHFQQIKSISFSPEPLPPHKECFSESLKLV